MSEEKITAGEPAGAATALEAPAAAFPPAAVESSPSRRPFSVFRLLKRTAVAAMAVVLLAEAVLAVLYWLYPIQLVEWFRYYYNPYEKSEVVTSEAPPDASTPLAASSLVDVDLPFTEKDKRHAIIYLPKGYQTGNKDLRFPTIYLLHGFPGTGIEWLKKGKAQACLDEAIEAHAVPPVIAVFPDGHPHLEDSEFINSADGKEPNEDFIAKTVVAYVDATYPTYADSRFRVVGGLSEGGFGALNMGLRRQDVFGYVLAIAGYGRVDKGAKTVQGSKQVIHDNSPLDYVPEMKRHSAKVLLYIGEQDGLLKENKEIAKVLEENKFSVRLEPAPGKHNWPFFTAGLKEGLVWWGKQLAADLTWEGSAPPAGEAPKTAPPK